MLDITEQANYQSINESYKIWKKNVPFLYNLLLTYELSSSSQTVQWFSETYNENDWNINSLLISTNSLTNNALIINQVPLPTDHAITDYTHYREEKADANVSANGYIGFMGQQTLNIKTSLPQASEVMKARIHPFDQNIIAAKTGGALPETLLYDLRNKATQIQENCIKLLGHTEEGFGLAWNPLNHNHLLSGGYDKKVIIWDLLQKTKTPYIQSQCSDGIEDVKWSNFTNSVFATAHQEEKVSLWDIRSDNKPFLSKKAHTGEVYSLDFNKNSEFLLLTGGEDGDICLWDIRNMSKKINTFTGHNDSVNVVSWSPFNPLQFASGSSDRKIVIWDIERLKLNTNDKQGNQILFIHGGHRSKVTDFSWGNEKDIAASCQQNNVLQVWKMNETFNEVY